MEKSKPYVILSAAISVDGKIATRTGDSKLSSKQDKVRLHKLRSKVDAILVGKNTVLRDNPLLTVRYTRGKNPISNNFIFTEFSPATITSTGNLCSLSKFDLLIFFDTAMIVGISLLVCRILDFLDITPLESKIILIGFFPLVYRTVNKGLSCKTVFFPTRIASTLDLSL